MQLIVKGATIKIKGGKKGKKYQHLYSKYGQSSSSGAKFWTHSSEFWSIRWHLSLEDTLSSCCKLTKSILLSTDFTQGIIKLIQCVCTLRGINWLFNLNQLSVNISYWNKRKLEQWLLLPTISRFIYIHSWKNLNSPEMKDQMNPTAGSGAGNGAARSPTCKLAFSTDSFSASSPPLPLVIKWL